MAAAFGQCGNDRIFRRFFLCLCAKASGGVAALSSGGVAVFFVSVSVCAGDLLSSTTKSAPTRRDQPELTVRVGSSPITDRLSSEPAVAGLPALAAMMFGPSGVARSRRSLAG